MLRLVKMKQKGNKVIFVTN